MKLSVLRRAIAATKRLLVRIFKAVVVVLLLIIPVPIASLFARGEKGPKANLPGQVVKKEEDDAG
ncbi:MAG: hypothetical protein IT380_12540 [Myxococcales bacterium]|nr:hypothetical protein [Myxococcales bacterium]